MVLSIREPSLPYIPHGKFGFYTGYIFTINVTIGAGFLSIPWAYENAGWLFSIFFQVLVSVQSYILARQLLESLSRAEILIRMTEIGKDIHGISLKKLFARPLHQEKLIQPPHLTPIITQRQISCPDMMKMVFGYRVGMAYLILMFLYQLGTMTAYSSIFASSFTSNVPIGTLETCDIYKTTTFFCSCRVKYWGYIMLFSAFTIYMTLKGIEEQFYVQFTMSVLRFLVIFIIIVTCIVDISYHKNNENDSYNSADMPSLINPTKIGHAIPILLFASTYQPQMPSITSSINNKPKNLPLVNLFAIITCFFFYTVLGMLASVAIDNVPSMSSLSYRDYTAGHSDSSRPAWTYLIEYLVIIAPALDVFSAFPLQAISISNAVISWKYGGIYDDAPKKTVFFIRFFIALLPSLIAFFEYDLGGILDWVGLIGFGVVYCSVPLLHIGLRHMVAGESSYNTNIHPALSWTIVIGNFLLFFVVVALNLTYS